MRESKIERLYCEKIAQLGGVSYKFVSPGVRGVPDRITLLPVPQWLAQILPRYIMFVEFKAPGKKQCVRQKRESDVIRKLGFPVKVIDNA